MSHNLVTPASVMTTAGKRNFPTFGVPNNLPPPLTYNSPNTIITNYFGGSLNISDMSCPYSVWSALSVNQEVPYLTLTNGNYLSVKKHETSSGIALAIHINGQRYTLTSLVDWTDCRYDSAVVFSDDGTRIVTTCVFFNSDHTKMLATSNTPLPYSFWDNFVNGSVAPTYTWKPFDMLAGNNGRYRCLLTKINEDAIGDPTTPIVTTDIDDFDRISEQANLLPIFQGLPLGETRTIAWSGENWLTVTASKNTEPDTNDYILLFKFWLRNTPTPIYTYNGRIQVDTYLQYPYLSFIVDDDQESAMFDPVTYYEDSASLHEPHWGYLARSQTELDMELLYIWLQGSVAAEPSDNPYDIGSEDNGGEGGNYQPQGHLPSNPLPSLDGLDLGLFTVYLPDDTELEAISQFLWSDNVLDNFKKYFTNFSDNIFALYVLPYTPENLPTKAFKVGRLTSETITSVKYLLTRYVTIDMGEVPVTPTYTAYLDYSPYTKFEIYLPGIGVQALDADEIMSPATMGGYLPETQGSVISLEYRLDLLTGIVVAYVKINGEVRYQFSGKIGMNMPLTGETYSNMIGAFVGAAAGFASTLVSGGLTAPMASAAVAGTVNAMKPDVYRGGNLTGDASMLAYDTPYLIKHIPNRAYLSDQNKFTGIPSYKTGKLSAFGGYTEVIEAHVEGISCTEEERGMILEALKGGVIL